MATGTVLLPDLKSAVVRSFWRHRLLHGSGARVSLDRSVTLRHPAPDHPCLASGRETISRSLRNVACPAERAAMEMALILSLQQRHLQVLRDDVEVGVFTSVFACLDALGLPGPRAVVDVGR